MERLGVPALSRASPYLYNTDADILAWADGMGKVREVFGPASAPRP
jgi:selenocysteine lyase/cysteine desulfurase